MIEYRTERVAPENEDAVTKMLSQFGWKPESWQEIYNENTEFAGSDANMFGTVTVHQRRRVTNYVSIKYSRDKEMPNYARLKELNEEYEGLSHMTPPREPRKPLARTIITAIFTTVLLLTAIIYAVAFFNVVGGNLTSIFPMLLFPGIFAAIMVPITVVGWVKYKRRLSSYYELQKSHEQCIARMAEIEKEAASLL